MGNNVEPQQDEKTPGSVINLSEDCVERLTKEEKESGKKRPGEELNIPEDISEKEQMMRLKCLDDAHSNTYEITIPAFYKLADEVEILTGDVRPKVCRGDELIHCLKRNPCCSIKCKPEMDKYIDCIDTFRINIMKERMECDLKEKRKEDQEIVEQFLKNENGDF